MVKQWVQPPINKNRLLPGGFLLGSHLTSFIFIIKGFIGILGEASNPVFSNSLHRFQ